MSTPRERFVAAMSEIGQKNNVHALRQAAEAFADAECRITIAHVGLCSGTQHCTKVHEACRASLLREIGL